MLGGNLNNSAGGQAVVNVYRAENEELTTWKYLGVLFDYPGQGEEHRMPTVLSAGEPLGSDRRQGQPVEYFVGDLNGNHEIHADTWRARRHGTRATTTRRTASRIHKTKQFSGVG